MSVSARDEFRSGLGLPASSKIVHSHAVLADARTAIEAEFAASCFRKTQLGRDVHNAQTYYVITGLSKRVLNALEAAGFSANQLIGLEPTVIVGDNVRAEEARVLAGSYDCTLGDACESILSGQGIFQHLQIGNCGGIYEFDTVYYHQSKDHVQARSLVEAARSFHPLRSIVHGGTLMRDVAIPNHAAIIFGHGGIEAIQLMAGSEAKPTMITYVGGNVVPYISPSLTHVQEIAGSGIIIGTSRGIMSAYQWSYDDAPATNGHGARSDLLFPIVSSVLTKDMQLRQLIVLSPNFDSKLAGFVYTLAKKANGEARNALVKYVMSLNKDVNGTADHYNCIGTPNPRAPFVVIDKDGTLNVRAVANIIASHAMKQHNLCESGLTVFWANLQERIMSNPRLATLYNILYHVPWKRLLKLLLNNLFPCAGYLVDLDSRWSLMEALGAVFGAWKIRGGIVCAIISKFFDVALPANLLKVFVAACGVFSATRKSFYPTLSAVTIGTEGGDVTDAAKQLEMAQAAIRKRSELVGPYVAHAMPILVDVPVMILSVFATIPFAPFLYLAKKYASKSQLEQILPFFNYGIRAPIVEEILKRFWKKFVGEAAGPIFGFVEHATNDGPLLQKSPNGFVDNAPAALLIRIAVHFGVSRSDNLYFNMLLHSLVNIVIVSFESWLGRDCFHSKMVLCLSSEQREEALFKMFTLPEMIDLMRDLLESFCSNVSQLGCSFNFLLPTGFSFPKAITALAGVVALVVWLLNGETKEKAFDVRDALVLNKRGQLFEGMSVTFGRMYSTYIARKEEPKIREGFAVIAEGRDKDNLEPIVEGEQVGLDENSAGMLIAITPGIKVNWVGRTDSASLLNSFQHRLTAPKYDGAFDEKIFNALTSTHLTVLSTWNSALLDRLEGGKFSHKGVVYELEVVDGFAKTRFLDPFGDEIIQELANMTTGMPARNKRRWNEAFEWEKENGFLGNIGKTNFFNKVEPVINTKDKAPRVVFSVVAQGVSMASVQLRRAMEPYAKASQYTGIINASGLNGVELAQAFKRALNESQGEYEYNCQEQMDQKERILRSLVVMVAGDDNATTTAELHDEDAKFLLARHHLVAVHSKLFGRDLEGPSTATRISGPYHKTSSWTLDDITFCSNRLWPALNGDQYITVFGPKIFKVIQSMFLYKGKTQMNGLKLHQKVWPTVCGTRLSAIDDLIKHHSYNPLFVVVLEVVRRFFANLLSQCRTDKYQGDCADLEYDRAEFEMQFKLRCETDGLKSHDSIVEKYLRIYGRPLQMILDDVNELDKALSCYSFNAAGELTGPVLPASFGKLVAVDCGLSNAEFDGFKLTNDELLSIHKDTGAVSNVAKAHSTSVDVIHQYILSHDVSRKGNGRTKNNWVYDTFVAAVKGAKKPVTVVMFGVMLGVNVFSPQAATAIHEICALDNVTRVLVFDKLGQNSLPAHAKLTCYDYQVSSLANGLIDGKNLVDHPFLKNIVVDTTVDKVFIASDIYCPGFPELQTDFPAILKSSINGVFKRPVTVLGFKVNAWAVSGKMVNWPDLPPTLCPFSGPGSEFFFFCSSRSKWSKRIINESYIRQKVVLPMKAALLMSSEAFVTAFGEPGTRFAGTRFTKEFDGTCWDTSYSQLTMPPTVRSLKHIYTTDNEIIKTNMDELFGLTTKQISATNKTTGMKIGVKLMMLSGIIYTSFGNGVANASETLLAWVLTLCSDTLGNINWEAAEDLLSRLSRQD